MNAFGANADREGVPALKTCCEKLSFKEYIPKFCVNSKTGAKIKADRGGGRMLFVRFH